MRNRAKIVSMLMLTAIMTVAPLGASAVGLHTAIIKGASATKAEVLSSIKETTVQIRVMRASGVVSDTLLQRLTDEVRDLERAMIDESGESAVRQQGVPQDVIMAWVDAGVVATGIQGAEAVKARAAVNQMIENWDIGVDIDNIAEAVNGTQTVVTGGNTSTPATPEVSKPDETIDSGETGVENFSAPNFEDVKGHWSESTVRTLVSQGAIAGFPDGSFRPNATISNEEFLAILMRTVTGKTYPKASDGQAWSEPIIQDARRAGVLTRFDMPYGTYQSPISRSDMARYTSKAMEHVLGEDYVDAKNVDKYIKDINSFKDKAYANDVRQVYAKGIIVGKASGTFDPGANATRAEAATIIERIKDKSKRKQVDLTNKYDFDISITTPKVIDSRVPGLARNVKPMPGDTFIKKDGTKVILKVGPRGVLGEGQGLDLYGGMTRYDGKVVQEGGMGSYFLVPEGTTGEYVTRNADGVLVDGSYSGDPYYSDIHGNHHFETEWQKIKAYESVHTVGKIQNPQHGQRAGYGDNFIYNAEHMTWKFDPMHEGL